MSNEASAVSVAVEILLYAAALQIYADANSGNGPGWRSLDRKIGRKSVGSAVLDLCAWDARPYPLTKD